MGIYTGQQGFARDAEEGNPSHVLGSNFRKQFASFLRFLDMNLLYGPFDHEYVHRINKNISTYSMICVHM